MEKKIVITGLALFILVLFLFLGVYLVKQITTIEPKAYGTSSDVQVDLANSYIFVSPLQALSGGEKIRVNIFILDGRGRGLPGKTVTIGSANGYAGASQDGSLRVDVIQSKSDEIGKAVFDISSNTPGLFLIEASVDGKSLPQRVSVVFK